MKTTWRLLFKTKDFGAEEDCGEGEVRLLATEVNSSKKIKSQLLTALSKKCWENRVRTLTSLWEACMLKA